ncbi:MAG: GNAT family N-acetyltransferase [Janthinobacterium lividum]
MLDMGPLAPEPQCRLPAKQKHSGRSVALIPLTVEHAPNLWKAAEGADRSWAYLGYGPFDTYGELEEHIAALASLERQPFFAVVPTGGEACGWVSYCDIELRNAALEIGSIWFSPALQRTRASTEAIYLLLDHAFAIGFNRVAWRCNALNLPSRNAALRLGFSFEGVWHQAQIIKGRWRDTAWYAQFLSTWSANKHLFDRWLADENFDETGRQLSALR